ncbi:MAG: tetratricopeptide repeat protein [Candidatus Aminicenantales bacterium]
MHLAKKSDHSPSAESAAPPGENDPRLAGFLYRLRKRKIAQTTAAFIAGGWLILEFVHWILIDHYHIHEKWLDVAFISILGAFLCTVVWRWFQSAEKHPGNVRVEVLLVPWVALLTMAVNMILILEIAGIQAIAWPIGLAALGLGIAWTVFKSLQWAARSPEARKEDVKEFIPSAVKSEKSIVVLPFKNISPEEDQEYFSDGITDEIIADLSRVRALRVISRSSAMTYKGSTKTVPEIARELNVRYVLEGSVRKSGENLRITAQLIEAGRETHLWSEKFVGNLVDIFDIQEKVSRAIVIALKQELAPDEEKTISDRPIQNLRAYECYLKARRDMVQCSKESMDRALQSLTYASKIYGESPLLYAAMGLVHLQLYNAGFRTNEETLKRSEQFLDKIISLEPESSHRYHLMGMIERSRGDPRKAVRSLKKAADLDPNDPDILGCLGYLLSLHMGRPELGKQHIKRLIEIDPLTAWNYYVASVYYLARGKMDRALSMIRRAVQMDLEDRKFRFWESWYLAAEGRTQEAIAVINRSVVESPPDRVALLSVLWQCALKGEKDRALKALAKPKRETLWNDSEAPWLIAGCFAQLGDKTEAMLWLEHAAARGWINHPLFSRIDPFLARIRGEERFRKLMECVRPEWENFTL